MRFSMLLQDRDSLGALADSIKVFEGGVIMISHNAGVFPAPVAVAAAAHGIPFV